VDKVIYFIWLPRSQFFLQVFGSW